MDDIEITFSSILAFGVQIFTFLLTFLNGFATWVAVWQDYRAGLDDGGGNWGI